MRMSMICCSVHVRAALAFSVLVAPSVGLAGDRLCTESVDNYTVLDPSGGANLPNSVTNGNGFRSTMLNAGGWQSGWSYTNTSVFDTDMIDPQRTGSYFDNDNTYFDPSGYAISYFTGHGVDPSSGGTCNTSADCMSPPPGATGNGVCRASPPNNRFCVYPSHRLAVTSSWADRHGHVVDYTSGQVAFGEGYYGNIFNAGTNGGVNLAVFDISHGVTSPFWLNELLPLFAGVHLFATIMPINGDTANMPNRGSTLASQYAANPNGSVAQAWMETMNGIPQYGTWGCGASVWNDYTNGGGHGINGCGCYFVMSVDSNQYWTDWHIYSEGWQGLKNDGMDADGAAWHTWMAICNYDSWTHPWAL
jgi:hypothetical protein